MLKLLQGSIESSGLAAQSFGEYQPLRPTFPRDRIEVHDEEPSRSRSLGGVAEASGLPWHISAE